MVGVELTRNNQEESIPFDGDPVGTGADAADATLGFSFEPFECSLVILLFEKWFQFFLASLIMFLRIKVSKKRSSSGSLDVP